MMFSTMYAGGVGGEYIGYCAECFADFSRCCLFRSLLIHSHFTPASPADIGANIGSYSVAVAGLRPAREVIFHIVVICRPPGDCH